MKTDPYCETNLMKLSKTRSLFAAASLALLAAGGANAAPAASIHNIVLVHGAFVTGAGWKPVYDILVRTAITSRSRSTR